MCIFQKCQMYKKGVSCLLLCLCSFSSCPHSQTSPFWCYKTSKGLFNVCSRLLCHSSVSEWGATRPSEAVHTVPFDPHLIWLRAGFEERSSYSCPTPVCLSACLLHLLVHADKAHTPDSSIPIQRHARMLCIPIHTPRDKPPPPGQI